MIMLSLQNLVQNIVVQCMQNVSRWVPQIRPLSQIFLWYTTAKLCQELLEQFYPRAKIQMIFRRQQQ